MVWAEHHLTIVLLAAVAVLILNALRHLGREVVHHVMLGALGGGLVSATAATKLTKPVALLANGSTADLPTGYKVDVGTTVRGAHEVTSAATVTTASVITPGTALILAVLLLFLTLIVTRRVKKKADMRKAKMKALQEGPLREGGGEG